MTIKEILSSSIIELRKTGTETANLDARVLLEHVLEKDSCDIISHPEMPLTNSQYSRFRSLIRRRKKGEPVAYLTGHKEFYGYDFFVNKNVLIPRPETELLVEQAIKYVKCQMSNVKNKEKISIIDIGTGSGCIIISMVLEAKKLMPNLLITDFCASDISKKALYVARKNAKLHQINKQIRFFHSDLFSNPRMPKKYDAIIANLPYVPSDSKSYKLEAKSLRHEPQDAIFAKDNGAEIIKKFLNQARSRINNDGLILIEIDPRNARELQHYAKNMFNKCKVDLIKDLSQKKRELIILT